MGDRGVPDYRAMSHEQLAARLKVAEDALTLAGWCGVRDDAERGEAALQAWMDWANMSGVALGPEDRPDLDAAIPELAARRRSRRAATLASFVAPRPPEDQ